MRTPFLLLIAILLAPISFQCNAKANHPFGQEKVTNLHFYMHDTLSGKDPSAVPVARSNITAKPGELVPYGSVFVMDDVLTEGPSRESKVVGNAQGMYMVSSKAPVSLVMGVDYEITDGPFNGSSFVVYSRNPIMTSDGRELAIVGGRGAFRMARGFALLKTYYLNMTNGDAIIEYNVTLLHF